MIEKIAISIAQLNKINRLAKRSKVVSRVVPPATTTTKRFVIEQGRLLDKAVGELPDVQRKSKDVVDQVTKIKSGFKGQGRQLEAKKIPYGHIVSRKMNPVKETIKFNGKGMGFEDLKWAKKKKDAGANFLTNSAVNSHEMQEGKSLTRKNFNAKKGLFGDGHVHPDVISGESNLIRTSPFSKKSTDKVREGLDQLRGYDGSLGKIKRSIPNFEYGKTKLSKAAKKKIARDHGFLSGTHASRKEDRIKSMIKGRSS